MFSALNSYMEYEREINKLCFLLNISQEEAQTLRKQMQDTVKKYPYDWDNAFYAAVSLMSYGDWTYERWEQCLSDPLYFDFWRMSKRAYF